MRAYARPGPRSLALRLALGLASALTPGCGDRGTSGGAALTVDDADFRGAVGDGALSLVEAILVATGELDVRGLSAQERARIDGSPGRGLRDEIRFAPGLVVAIRRQEKPVDSILPPLTDTGDSIEGDGAVLDGSAMGTEPQPAPADNTIDLRPDSFAASSAAPLLVVAASDVEISGLGIDAVPATAILVMGRRDPGIANVVVRDNVVRGVGRELSYGGITLVGHRSDSDGRLRSVLVEANRITDVFGAIAIIGGNAFGDGAEAKGNEVTDVRVVGNTIEDVTEGIQVCGGAAMMRGSSSDNLVRGIVVEENRVTGGLDTSLLLSTSCTIGDGLSARNRVEDVVMRKNELAAAPDVGPSYAAVYVTAGQVFAGRVSEQDRLSQVTIADNVVTGTDAGLVLVAGWADRCGDACRVSDSLIEGVELAGNRWRDVENGLVIAGGQAIETAALVRDNALREVSIAGEEIVARSAGVVLIGSVAMSWEPVGECPGCRIVFPGFEQPGVVTANRVSDFVLRGSSIEATDAIVISGGTMNDTEDTITESEVRDVALESNRISAIRTGIALIGGVVVGQGTVHDSRVETVRCSANVDGAGSPLAAVTLDQLATDGVPAGSVRGNAVLDVSCQ